MFLMGERVLYGVGGLWIARVLIILLAEPRVFISSALISIARQRSLLAPHGSPSTTHTPRCPTKTASLQPDGQATRSSLAPAAA